MGANLFLKNFNLLCGYGNILFQKLSKLSGPGVRRCHIFHRSGAVCQRCDTYNFPARVLDK